MKILNELRTCWKNKQPAALATIIAVDGSVYRKAGARCLIHQDGRITGIVSGGCVEGNLFEHAQNVMKTSICKQVEYDFRPADDVLWGLGLGCNGAMTLLIQPFDPVSRPEFAHNLLTKFEQHFLGHSSSFMGTIVASENEEKVAVGKIVELGQDVEGLEGGWNSLITQLVDEVKVEMFVEWIEMQQRLVIIGAGADAKPLTHIAKFLEWHVTVVDHRKDLLTKNNFPDVDEFVLTPRDNYGEILFPASTSVVIMTHNYELDKLAIGRLLQKDLFYLGQLGPRKRMERIFKDLHLEGNTIEQTSYQQLHNPIGLDIGAETPEEIALCIVGEICARRNRRTGRSLREKYHPAREEDVHLSS